MEERGRPEFTTTIRADKLGRITRVTLNIRDPLQRGLVWPQRLRVAFGFPAGVRDVPVTVTGNTARVPQTARMARPLYILPNGSGLGYGLFILDETSRQYLLQHLEDIPDPLTRGSAWVTLWDNLLESQFTPGQFLDLVVRALPRETDEQNIQRVLGYATRAFWRSAAG